MKTIFGFVTILITSSSFTQISMHATFFSGIGKMKNTYEKEWFNYDTEFKTTYSPTYGGGIEFLIPLKIEKLNVGKFRIKSGLTYDFIESNQKESVKAQDLHTGKDVRIIAEKRFAAHYLRLPINFEYVVSDINFGLGAQIGYRITNSAWSKYYTEEANGTIGYGLSAAVNSTGNNLNKFDFGILSQIGYQIHDRLNLFVGMYNGLMDVGNNADRGLKYDVMNIESIIEEPRLMRNTQMKIGASFKLF